MDSKLLCDLYRAMIYGGEMVIYRGTAPDDVVADFREGTGRTGIAPRYNDESQNHRPTTRSEGTGNE